MHNTFTTATGYSNAGNTMTGNIITQPETPALESLYNQFGTICADVSNVSSRLEVLADRMFGMTPKPVEPQPKDPQPNSAISQLHACAEHLASLANICKRELARLERL